MQHRRGRPIIRDEMLPFDRPGVHAAPTATLRRLMATVGLRAVDPEGRNLGRVEAVVVDRQTGEPLWLTIHRRGRDRRLAVPADAILAGGDRVHVAHGLARIERGPVLPADGSFTVRQEQDLCRTFGRAPTRGARLSRWERRRSTALATAAADGTVSWSPGPRFAGDRAAAEAELAALAASPAALAA